MLVTPATVHIQPLGRSLLLPSLPPYSVLFMFLLCRYLNDQNVRTTRVNLYGKPARQYPTVFRNPRRFAGRPQSGAAIDVVVVIAALVTRCRRN